MENETKISEEINKLILKNTDLHHLYLSLAEAAEGDLLKGILKSHADKHRMMNLELVSELKALIPHANINVEGSFVGGITRGWEELKKSFNLESDDGIRASLKDAHTECLALYKKINAAISNTHKSIFEQLNAHISWLSTKEL